MWLLLPSNRTTKKKSPAHVLLLLCSTPSPYRVLRSSTERARGADQLVLETAGRLSAFVMLPNGTTDSRVAVLVFCTHAQSSSIWENINMLWDAALPTVVCKHGLRAQPLTKEKAADLTQFRPLSTSSTAVYRHPQNTRMCIGRGVSRHEGLTSSTHTQTASAHATRPATITRKTQATVRAFPIPPPRKEVVGILFYRLPPSLPPAEREGAGCEVGARAGPALRASPTGAAEGITKASPTASEATAATSATIIVASFIVSLCLCLFGVQGAEM